MAYLVQPLLAADTLGHNVLRSTTPDAEHPFLLAVGEAINVADERISIDAQVTNWSWDGTTASLLDVGTPFMWDSTGTYRLDVSPMTRMLPGLLRKPIGNDILKSIERWRTPRNVGADVVANMYREGLDDWIDPTVAALNRVIGPAEPITAELAHELYLEDGKTWPRLKKLQQVERLWQTKVRRRPYDFLIQQSTYK